MAVFEGSGVQRGFREDIEVTQTLGGIDIRAIGIEWKTSFLTSETLTTEIFGPHEKTVKS